MNESSAKFAITKYSELILNGQIVLDLVPSPPADTIRVYLSSTATDFSDERSAIWQVISPKIREWTRAKYGLEFQLIDLHWEDKPEISEDQLTLDFVQQELRYCHQTSLGPCFVALLGQRYGRSPLPVVIAQDEFETIRNSLSRHLSRETRDQDILDHYYILDMNGVPPIYRLIPAGNNIKSAAPIGSVLRSVSDEDRIKLSEELGRVRFLIQRGAELSVADGTMEAGAAEKFIRSVLDQELRMGIGESAMADKRCLVFIRSIVDLAEQAERGSTLILPTVKRFAELAERNPSKILNGAVAELSSSSQQLLDLLRENLIEVRLPVENVKQAKVIWRFDKGISPDIFTHRAYLDQLCEIFYSTMIHLIKENIGFQPQILTEPSSAHERFKWDALHSWYLVQQMATPDALYVGYDFQIESIRRYIRASIDDPKGETVAIQNRQPLIVCGLPGSGKSTLIARLALATREWMSGCSIVVRFCGLSSSANSLLLILDSVCRQLEAIVVGPGFTSSTSLPPSEDLLISRMWAQLAAIPKTMSVVLLFDGVDRLEPPFPGWLPPSLPPNVSIVATVAANNVTQAIRLCGMGGVVPESNILELSGLGPDDSVEMLNALLDEKNRKLTIDQSHIFTQLIEHVAGHEESGCLPPFYVKLLATIAEAYVSDQESDTNGSSPLPKSLAEAINYLFDKLEIAHGFTVVSAMFSLLSAANCALTDCEIEDVLSLDEAFMAVIHNGDIIHALKHSTIVPIRRAPPVLWLRLRSDMRQFLLATWETGGQTAWWWRHSSLAAAARQRYLREGGDAHRRLHSRLADYWLGPVSNSLPAENGRESSQSLVETKTSELLIPQPVILQKFGYKTHNVRKLRNLPAQLAGAERWTELLACCLFSYEWIYHKTCALGLSDVILDYSLTNDSPTQSHSVESTLVAEALKDIGKTVDFGVVIGDSPSTPKRPSAISCLSTELSSRLLPYADSSDNIRSLIVQCDLLGLSHTALLPLLPHPSTPGAALLAELTFRPDGRSASPDFLKVVQVFDDQVLLFAKTERSSTVGCFQLPVPRRFGSMDASPAISAPWDVQCSAGKMLLFTECGLVATVDPDTKRAIKFHDLSSGTFYGQLIPQPDRSPPSTADDQLVATIRPATLSKTEISSVELGAGILIVSINASGAEYTEIQAFDLRDCPDPLMFQNAAQHFRWTPPMITSVILPGKASFAIPSLSGASVFCGVNSALCIVSLQSGQVEFLLPAPGRVSAAVSNMDESCIVALCKDDASILVLNDHSRFSAVEALTTDGSKIQFTRLGISPSDSYVAVWNKGLIDIMVTASAKQVSRIVNPFAAPPTSAGIETNRSLSEMHAFGQVIFTPNEEIVIASAGRWLLLWKPVSGQPIARLQAELGVVDQLIATSKGRLLVSHVKGSPVIQVWNLEMSSQQSDGRPTTMPTLPASGIDHLPNEIESLSVVADGQLVFARLKNSQVIGVFSMANGRLVRALEHDSTVVNLVPVPSGQYCLVSTVNNYRRNAANRLWDVVDSRVMYRFGNDPGFAVALHRSESIVHISRMTPSVTLHDPYTVCIYNFGGENGFQLAKLLFEVRYVLSKPFITSDDSRCVFLVANSFDETRDVYGDKAVCVCDISSPSVNAAVATFGMAQLSDFVNVSEIISVVDWPSMATNVIVLYQCAPSRLSTRQRRRSVSTGIGRSVLSSRKDSAESARLGSEIVVASRNNESQSEDVEAEDDETKTLGYLILDVTTGTVIRCCEYFLTPSSLPISVSTDLHIVMDAKGAMYDFLAGHMVLPSIHERGWPLQAFLNNGKLAVFSEPPSPGGNNRLQVLRTSDCKLVGWVRLWSPITCATTYGEGEHARLLVGCADGSFSAYMVIDRQIEDSQLLGTSENVMTELSQLLPNRTTPTAYAQSTELLQMFTSGRISNDRDARTAPLFLYKEGRLVSSLAINRSPSATNITDKLLRKGSKPLTPPPRLSSGISASTVSFVRQGGLAPHFRPREFRSAACSLM